MAGTATVYLEQRVLSHTLAYGAYTAPTLVFLALCTSEPSRTVAGTEVVGGGYARIQGTFALAGTPDNVASNAATIEYPTATASWGTVGWFEVWDAVSGGNRLYWGPLVDPADGVTPITRSIQTSDIVRFQAGVVQIQAT